MQLNSNRLLKVSFIRLSLFIFIVGLFTSCLDEFEGNQVIVLSEGLLEVTSEDVTLLGRLLTTTERPSEVGFYVDVSSDFNSPIILPSEQVPDLGNFISISNVLDYETPYFARAYAVVGGQTFFGDVLTFTTNLPSITSIDPLQAAIGDRVTITGLNITNDVRVFFGTQEAEVISLVDKSILTVIVPDIDMDVSTDIELVMQDEPFVFSDPFTYHTGSWQDFNEFPFDNQFRSTVFMQADNQVVLGYGRDITGGGNNPLFFLFDNSASSWSVIDGPSVLNPILQPINYENGFGGGTILITPVGLIQANQSWSLDFDTFTWTNNPDLTIPGLSDAVSVKLNGVDYIFGGFDAEPDVQSTIWSGNIETGDLNFVSDAPVSILATEAYFVYDDKFYYQSDEFTLVEYNPVSDTWSDFIVFDENIGTLNIATVIGDKAIIGLGLQSVRMYQIDMLNKTVIQKNTFTGPGNERNVIHWSYDDKLYVLRTSSTVQSTVRGFDRMIVWELDPFALRQ